MRKTMVILASLFFSLQVFAGAGGTTTYGTSASFGTPPTCTGKGICGTGASRGDGTSIPVTFTYTAATLVFKIVIADTYLQSNNITIFNGPNYNFDADWTAAQDVIDALGAPIVVKAGAVGTISDNGTNKTITYTLTP